MGKYSKGIIGAINGLIGAVADSTWKGIDYMHSRPQKSKAAALRQELQYTMLLPANFSGW
jgi:hypothetical protein